MKKYYTDWAGITTLFSIGLAIWISGAYLEARPDTFINASLGMTTVVMIVILLATVYSYASIEGSVLRFVYVLFQRRTIDINSITEINDQSTYKAAKSAFRSLYIFYKDKSGETKYIELRITIFPEKTLGRLIRDLKEINPNIQLNKYSEKLMNSASDK